MNWLTREGGMIDLFNRGGFAMWILLILSVIAIAFIVERVVTFSKTRLNPKKFASDLKTEINKKGPAGGIALCNENPSPVAKILAPAIEKYRFGKAVMEEVIARAGTTELAFLDRGMLVLASIATVAPLVGFLGTVIGIIKAFGTIQAAGEVNPADVAGGISEALITTATGLLIAAPVAIFHAFFTSKINSYQRDMEDGANDLVEFLLEQKEEK